MARDEDSEVDSLHCSNCGAQLHITSADDDFVTCDYCGSTYSVAELLGGDAKPVRPYQPQSRQPQPQQPRSHQPQQEVASPKEVAAKAARVKVIFILIAVLTVIVLISDIGSVLFDAHDDEETGVDAGIAYESYDWNSLVLGSQIPAFDADKAHILTNRNEELYIEFPDVDETAYRSYVAACKEAGYTVEQEYSEIYFRAFNEDGYHLEIFLFSEGRMNIEVDAPKPVTALVWPSGSIAGQIPAPDAEQGYISSADNYSFAAYIDGMSRDKVKAYMQQCIDAGFDQQESMGDDYLTARKGSLRLSISYEGNNVMYVTLYDYD